MDSRCKICDWPGTCLERNGTYEFKCSRCGFFFITEEAIELLHAHKEYELTPTRIANLSGWLREHQGEIITDKNLSYLLHMPTPNIYEKSRKLLEWINKKIERPGQTLAINSDLDGELIAVSWAYDRPECQYVYRYLVHEMKFITNNPSRVEITPSGYIYLENLNRNIDSNIGFCAMWFDPLLLPAWENAISPAITSAGYEPKRIDKAHYNGAVVDEIISIIRRSRFVVTDLTADTVKGDRGGVYYEAGFAKGLGLEVIFTCEKGYLEKLHFDVKHYNFLEWDRNDLNGFKERLHNRIEATIGRGFANLSIS